MHYCDESKPYIFISYSHRDTQKVVDIISRLREEGYNVWYDDGIDPGTEWDENIARHVQGCSYFIAFISENYLNSKNCKDELNYSRDLDKNQLLVYFEDVSLPSGMAMRMNRLQAIFWNKYAEMNQEEPFKRLFAAEGINVTKVFEKEEELSINTEGYLFDANGNPYKGKFAKDINGNIYPTEYAYDINGNVYQGDTVYDAAGNAYKITFVQNTNSRDIKKDNATTVPKTKNEDVTKQKKVRDNTKNMSGAGSKSKKKWPIIAVAVLAVVLIAACIVLLVNRKSYSNEGLDYIHVKEGETIDPYKAYLCFEKSSLEGDKISSFFAGATLQIYLSDSEYYKPEKIAEYYRSCMDEIPYAKLGLGVLYSSKKLKDQDPDYGNELIRSALNEIDEEELVKDKKLPYKGEACYILAGTYNNGYGISKDVLTAKQWYERAADNNCVKAYHSIAKIYATGEVVDKNFATAVEWAKKGEKYNEMSSVLMLGYIYSLGDGYIEKDEEVAISYNKRAAELGDIVAYHNLGVIYINTDPQLAYEYFEKAAKGGYTKSMRKLGDMCLNKDYPFADEELAFEWYKKAVDAGDVEAYDDLAALYYKGKGIGENAEKAYDLFVKGAEEGNAYSMRMLGNLYNNGSETIEKDLNKAVEWYQKAFDAGDIRSSWLLGNVYVKENTELSDINQAADWYKKGAEAGDYPAKYELAKLYYAGQGVTKDKKKAVEMLEEIIASADHSIDDVTVSDAYDTLGNLYCTDEEIGLDIEYAISCFENSLALFVDDAYANESLARIYMNAYNKYDGYADSDKAFYYANKAVEFQSLEGYHDLAYCYEKGLGVEKDLKKALEYYEKSIENGYLYDCYLVGCVYRDGVKEWFSPDYIKAYNYYIMGYNAGYGVNAFAIGEMYENGQLGEADLSLAKEWYTKALNAARPYEKAQESLDRLADK